MPTLATLVGFEADFRAIKDATTLGMLESLLQQGQDGDADVEWFTRHFAISIAAASPLVTLVAAVEDDFGNRELIEVTDGKAITAAASRGESRERFDALVGVETVLTPEPTPEQLLEGSLAAKLRALDTAKWTSAQLISALDAPSNQDPELRTRLFQVLTMKTSAQVFERVLRGLREEDASVAKELDALIWRQGTHVTRVLEELEAEWRRADSNETYVQRLITISTELPDIEAWLRETDTELAAAINKARSPSEDVGLPRALSELPEVDSAALRRLTTFRLPDRDLIKGCNLQTLIAAVRHPRNHKDGDSRERFRCALFFEISKFDDPAVAGELVRGIAEETDYVASSLKSLVRHQPLILSSLTRLLLDTWNAEPREEKTFRRLADIAFEYRDQLEAWHELPRGLQEAVGLR